MGAFFRWIRQLWLALVGSSNIRYSVQPAAAGPVACVSDGVVAAWAWAPYVQIVAAGVIPNPCWLIGVSIHDPVVESHNGDIAIASGAATAEVDLAMLHFNGIWPVVGATAASVANAIPRAVYEMPIWLPNPIRIVGSPRLACRIRKSTAASAAGVSLKAILAENLGT